MKTYEQEMAERKLVGVSNADLIVDFADRWHGARGKSSMESIIDCACDDREITDAQEAFLLAHFAAHPMSY